MVKEGERLHLERVKVSSRKGKGVKDSGSVSGQKDKGTTTKNDLLLSAVSIKVKEKVDIAQDEFCPLYISS